MNLFSLDSPKLRLSRGETPSLAALLGEQVACLETVLRSCDDLEVTESVKTHMEVAVIQKSVPIQL